MNENVTIELVHRVLQKELNEESFNARLAPHLVYEDDVLYLKAGWLTGCNLVGYIFFFLGSYAVWIGLQLSFDRFELFIYWGCLVLPFFGIALWMGSRRTHWRLDREGIQKKVGYRLATRQQFSADGIRGVEVIQQYHGGRFSQLAPGIILLTSGGSIDLGANGNPETVRKIGKAVAEFYSVEFKERTRDEDFRTFRRHKLLKLLVALVIAALIIVVQEFLKRR
ncbi:MAG: hypothetical protein ACI9G1_002962 [Pirellulaceae bacterium]|jgi:hypothetical protein